MLKAVTSQKEKRRRFCECQKQTHSIPRPPWPAVLPSLAPSTHSSMLAAAYQIFTLTFSNVYIIYFTVHKIFTSHAKYTSYFCWAVLFPL